MLDKYKYQEKNHFLIFSALSLRLLIWKHDLLKKKLFLCLQLWFIMIEKEKNEGNQHKMDSESLGRGGFETSVFLQILHFL